MERKVEHRDCLIPQIFQDMISLQCYLKPTTQVDAGVLVLKTTYKKALMNGERLKINIGKKKKKKTTTTTTTTKQERKCLTMRNYSYLNKSDETPKAIVFTGLFTPNPQPLFKKQLYI